MYHKLVPSLYDGELESQDRYIAFGDLVLTLFILKTFGLKQTRLAAICSPNLLVKN